MRLVRLWSGFATVLPRTGILAPSQRRCLSLASRVCAVSPLLGRLHQLIETLTKGPDNTNYKGLLQHNLQIMAKADPRICYDPSRIYVTAEVREDLDVFHYTKAALNLMPKPFYAMPPKNLYFKSKRQSEMMAALCACLALERMDALRITESCVPPSVMWPRIFQDDLVIEHYEEDISMIKTNSLHDPPFFEIPNWGASGPLLCYIYELFWTFKSAEKTENIRLHVISPHEILIPPLSLSMSGFNSQFSVMQVYKQELTHEQRKEISRVAEIEKTMSNCPTLSNFSSDSYIYYVGTLLWNPKTNQLIPNSGKSSEINLGLYPLSLKYVHQNLERLGIYIQSLIGHHRGKKYFENAAGRLAVDPHTLIQACTHPSLMSRLSSRYTPRIDSSKQPDRNLARFPIYQRLEYLGDSILDLSISIWASKRFSSNLLINSTIQKGKLACNDSLRELASKLHIEKLILGSNVNFERLTSSVLADVLESIVGAIYVDEGLRSACRFCMRHVIGLNENECSELLDDEQFCELYFPSSKTNIPSKYVKITNEVKNELGISFNNPDYLLRATNNSEYLKREYPNMSADYVSLQQERLRILGISLLKFHLSCYLYHTFPSFNESHLTKIRCHLVSNQYLSKIFENNKIRKTLNDNRGYPKVISESDMAEKIINIVTAEYIDRGLFTKAHNKKSLLILENTASEPSFVYKHVIPNSKVLSSWVESIELINPKGYLQEYCLQRWTIRPNYETLDTTHTADGRPFFTVGLWIRGKSYGTGSGYSLLEAQERAAKIAIQNLRAEGKINGET